MTVNIKIIDTTIDHINELSTTLRENDKLEIQRIGLDILEGLNYSFKNSIYRKTALIEDKVAAIWGVLGTYLGDYGCPYFLTSNEVDKISSIQFARLYFKEVEFLKDKFPRLENFVDSKYLGAVRMLRLAGFKLNDPELINGNEFNKFILEGSI